MIMGLVCWLVFGVLAGAAARRVMPGPSVGGAPMAILIGVGGALIGGIIGTSLPAGTTTDFDLRSMLMAVTGTLLLLLCYHEYAFKTGLQTRR